MQGDARLVETSTFRHRLDGEAFREF